MHMYANRALFILAVIGTLLSGCSSTPAPTVQTPPSPSPKVRATDPPPSPRVVPPSIPPSAAATAFTPTAIAPSAAATQDPGVPGGDIAANDDVFPTDSITAQVAATGGQWSVLIQDIDTGQVMYERDADVTVPAAGFAALPVCVAAYRAAADGTISMNDPIGGGATNNGADTSLMERVTAQPTSTVHDQCQLALGKGDPVGEGDPVAADRVLAHLGVEQVEAALTAWGLQHTTVRGQEQRITARDLARIMTVVVNGTGLGADDPTAIFGLTADEHDHGGTDTIVPDHERDTPLTRGVNESYLAWHTTMSSTTRSYSAALMQSGLGGRRLILIILSENGTDGSTTVTNIATDVDQ